MNDDSAFARCTTYTYNDGRLISIADAAGRRGLPAAPADPTWPPPASFTLAHDPEERVFLLTGPDGKTEVFRDNPTRYLSVAPDPQTGEMKPVMKHGKATYLWLCREERDVH
jgi:hypothetical protein